MMNLPFIFLLPLITFYYSSLVSTSSTSSSSKSVLTQGSSLFVEEKDHLVSPNGLFTAGFHETGENAYYFAIWFSEATMDGKYTLVWTANRDWPVNGKRSSFSLSRSGNLVLTDAGENIWTTNTRSNSPLQLQLLDSGNLVVTELDNQQSYLWQSFSFPTDTLLPNQPFTRDTVLVSSTSSTNSSSGFYRLYFDNDNVIRLLFSSSEVKVTSIYWPSTYLLTWEAGRTANNNTRFAFLDSKGLFQSSDNLTFTTTDYGDAPIQRRLTLDVDGNIRVYSLINQTRSWSVSWQTFSTPCLYGICGPNSLCTHTLQSGRICSCMHGYKAKNHSDLSLGCEPTFDIFQPQEHFGFIKLTNVEFYGFDSIYNTNSTFKDCTKACLNDSSCKAFQFTFHEKLRTFTCHIKFLLFNGYYKGPQYNTYLKLPKNDVSSYTQYVANKSSLDCSSSLIQLERTYGKKNANGSINFILWFSIILGGIEVISFGFFYYITKQPSGTTTQTYLAIATGFKRFTYAEIAKATRNFKEEIGRGGGGVVYKGVLPDERVVAVKRLHEAIQGEAEFLAEMSPIGRINHRNLIETYGYCAEGKHRILVYEYMANGSLSENLVGNELDWKNMFEIASGIARGLAYLHEECLEWVLHCDVKPKNILLDANYNPKVADFGLSKLFNQGVTENSTFSKIRGTRGYMAPEWLFNLPITSKVDVYSYGMVVLEMITGRSPTHEQPRGGDETLEPKRLVGWVREKVHATRESLTETQVAEILNPMINGEYEKGQIINLLNVALKCVEEDIDARPTMSEVVKMLMQEMDD